MQDIVDICHDNDNFINNFKRHDLCIRKIKIMFSNEFDSIKVRKILQISKILRINIQLSSLNQFNKNVFKLMIIDSHLIVDISFIFIFL